MISLMLSPEPWLVSFCCQENKIYVKMDIVIDDVKEGLLVTEKKGKTMYYRRAEAVSMCSTDTLDFFSEVSPCGVIGSYLLDKLPGHDGCFVFKHHYITGAMDSEILKILFEARPQKRNITLVTTNRYRDKILENYDVEVDIDFFNYKKNK